MFVASLVIVNRASGTTAPVASCIVPPSCALVVPWPKAIAKNINNTASVAAARCFHVLLLEFAFLISSSCFSILNAPLWRAMCEIVHPVGRGRRLSPAHEDQLLHLLSAHNCSHRTLRSE